MADLPGALPPNPPPAGFPQQDFPVIFSDGVISAANSRTFVKFYLGRTDPDYLGTGRSQTQAVAQIVMPMEAFVGAVAFFEGALARFVRDGIISREAIDSARKLVGMTV